jgi:hypothetical protein
VRLRPLRWVNDADRPRQHNRGVPTPRPAPASRLPDAWWASGLALLALGLFGAGFVERLRCGRRGCPGAPLTQLLDLDAVGGLPRLFTTALFVAVAWLAWRARRQVSGRARLWWTALSAVGAGLALVKVASAHNTLEQDVPPALAAGLTVVVLAALTVSGRRWAVAATVPVVLALALYAASALGLDLLTTAAALAQEQTGRFTAAAAVFVEELGEALAALLLLVVVCRTARAAGQSVRQQ